MSTLRTAKPRKPSTKGRVKIDQEEHKLKVDREEIKENSDSLGIRIPSGFDPDPVIALRTSLKKDEPTDDHGGVKHEDKKPTNVKQDGTKQEQEHTKREIKSALSAAHLWEHGADGQPYIPRPGPVRNKHEDVVDPPDAGFEQENLPGYEDGQARPPPLPSPPPTMPEVEVVLPRWEDVRRQKAARGTQARRAPLVPGPANARQAPRQDLIVIKPELEDDVKLLLGLEEHDPAEARAVLRTAVQNLRNPVAKVKKELLLDDEFLLDALTWEGINYKYPIPLPKAVSEFQFKREYISHLYGGNTQETFPKPRDEMLKLHALNDWSFLSLDYNPHAPTKPGHSGLFFSSHRATPEWCANRIYRTIVRVMSGKWVYMGQYKMEAGLSLTAENWKQQKQTARQAWAEGILHAGWGWRNCVRIWLRKQHGADYKIKKKDMRRGEANLERIYASLTEEDIMGTYDRGEEEMGTYRMTCIGYEAEFVDVLVRNMPAWIVFDKEVKAKRGEAKGKGKQARKGKGKGPGTGSKRKPIEIDSESDSEEDGGDDVEMEVKAGSDDSYQGMPVDLPRSSTGRPRRAAAMVKRQRTS
ncbi:hypothetical protein V8D89_016162 [Ganoderma adspersum]